MTESASNRPPAAGVRLDVRQLSKTFGRARVLREIDLAVVPGEIHGLVGQNGCGKSTLVKILTGVHAPDAGAAVSVDGMPLRLPPRPEDLHSAGVSVVHQNLGLVDDETVWENVRLGRFRARRLSRRVRVRDERRAVEEALERLGRRLDTDVQVGRLSAEERATVAIARALQDHRPGRGLIIFDESTKALGRPARRRFFDLVRGVLSDGASVLLISHQLEEIIQEADRVTVLRDGAVVAAGVPTSEVDEVALTGMMLGRHLVTHTRIETRQVAATAAQLRGLEVDGVHGLDLDVGSGEIVGVTGLLGSGFEAVSEALGGARRCRAGTLSVGGATLPLDARRGSTRDFIAAGIGFVPEQRLTDGLATDLSVRDNITLPRVTSRGSALHLGSQWQRAEADAVISRLDIKPPSAEAPVATLSGGNQQKVLLGRWLAASPRLLVLREPTQAVDVGARHDIIDALRDLAGAGCGVVVASVDAADLAVLCDRVLVFHDGQVVAELTGELEQDDIVHATFATPATPPASSGQPPAGVDLAAPMAKGPGAR